MLRILMIIGSLLLPVATSAQQDSGTFEFNLFSMEGFERSRVYNFDAGYTERFGIEVPVPFTISRPIVSELNVISDGAPDKGFVKFTYVAGPDDAPVDERVFVESFEVYEMNVPMMSASDDPMTERLNGIGPLMYGQVFQQATAPHSNGEMLGWQRSEINGLEVIDVIGTFTHQIWGPMFLRIVAFPNPNGAQSYFVINNISLNMVPISDVSQLPETIGGRIFESFAYLSE